ncbi:hypothetical protein NM092_002546 [Vibrio cholerae]|uniref:hypothetical protein n=2 Tax=Vibrio cholerae TaxID=666 RepID=UPI00115B3BD2|nr:hypothetical protein [Vibrio cholerae]EGQ8491662.1 hypothetical protein [Vibrio cholerae]EGR1449037.1 hypothetical protein [Vibrio cholerae]EJL7928588.1 hypothetical protein [Vibrio cholerae]EKF9629453.1 hypothetical protein [Vibrio cholerae]MBU5698330.1 hypothetical protein [Vibrio cholerae]
MMKKIAALCLLFVSSFGVASVELTDAQQKVTEYFISSEEPKVKDATWTAPDIFKVGVFDDGSRRNGYAEYVCMVLYDHGLKGKKVWVHVVDIEKVINDKRFVKLGEAQCL